MRLDLSGYAVGDAIWVAQSAGWNTHTATKGSVTKRTPTGRLTVSLGHRVLVFMPRNRVVGEGSSWLSSARIVSEQEAQAILTEQRKETAWYNVSKAAEQLERAARKQDEELARTLLADIASAIEAATAGETETGSTVGESAVPLAGDAQPPSSEPSHD